MSDIRINSSPHPLPEPTEASASDHPQVPANTCAEHAKNPNAEYDQVTKSGLPEHLFEQQGQALKPGDLHSSNPVEAGMQSASEWLLRQGKLMQSEVEHRAESTKHTDSPDFSHKSSVERK